jgi:ATP-dependent Lon protease
VSETSQAPDPPRLLILVPLRDTVIFPGPVLQLTVGSAQAVQAVDEATRKEQPIGLLAQRSSVEEPGGVDLYGIGVVADILRMAALPSGERQLIVHGRQRFRLLRLLQERPALLAEVEILQPRPLSGTRLEAHLLVLRQQARRALELLPRQMPELARLIDDINQPGLLTDFIASALDLPLSERQELLETVDLEERIQKVSTRLTHQIEVLELARRIGNETKGAMDRAQREYFLREQLRTIQRELGVADGKAAEVEALRRRLQQAGMPPEVEQHAMRELAQLERTPEGAAESSMLRTYLEWLAELPFGVLTPESIDIAEARRVLDEDHHDIDKVKRRILEYLAVRKLSRGAQSPILCFVGPPGVGKTSLGQSIARATGRRFVRQSLGGVHDEAEIRGHRRTYVGALPGRIVQGIRRAGSRNPVFMLDEIDKLGASLHGAPASALLEVLDPEQNHAFEDHYLGVPFDLRAVLFIATANVLSDIPGPLRDRMEVIELPGYTEEDKLQIARRHLLPRQLLAAGLSPEQLALDDDALREVIRAYTREARVRQLERALGSICRGAALRIAEQTEKAGEERPADPLLVRAEDVRAYLGPPQHFSEVALRTSVPGVATGLAWTPSGGELLFIEATRVPGSGQLLLTGQLGEVMKESAQAALSLAKARADALGIPRETFRDGDIHIHVPAGAIPKDGPSAGVTLFTALVSLLLGRCVRHDVAMTGEISLRGLVLPVGGIKEKVLAARRAGIRRVLLPELNRASYEEDLPAEVRAGLEASFLTTVDQALEAALLPAEVPPIPSCSSGSAPSRGGPRRRSTTPRARRARRIPWADPARASRDALQ